MTARVIAFMKRLDSVSSEDFHRLWTDHGKLVVTHITPVKTGVVKYKQFHSVPKMAAVLADGGFPVADYDGVVEWAAENLEDIVKIFASKEYLEHLHPHEALFFNRAAVQVMSGNVIEDFNRTETCVEVK